MNASVDNAKELPIVDGATRLYGIIGDPIAQVKSPEILTARIRAAQRNALLLPMHVKPELFDETVRGLKALANLDGIVITVPYKPRIVPFVDRLLPTGERVERSTRCGANRTVGGSATCSTARACCSACANRARSEGVTRDAARRRRRGQRDCRAVADAGAASLTIADVDVNKAGELAKRIKKWHPGCAARTGEPTVDGIDILINATPIGMADSDPLPMKLGKLDPKFVAADVIVKPGPTPFLKQAEACGCRSSAAAP